MRSLGRIRPLALTICAALCIARVSDGPIHQFGGGTVTDLSGAAVPTASVTLLNKGTGIKTTIQSKTGGYYLFPSFRPETL